MESSSFDSSHQNPQWKYHVFLSFRGADTRHGFTDHLYAALKQNGILTFRDDEGLERGEVISPQLVKAIHESLFAIVILSPNYPYSSWCLDELHEILESTRVPGRQAFPVFYGVDPSHLRHQKEESIAKAFEKHEERYGEDRVQKWRQALKKMANLSGWDSKNRQEPEVIKEIVQEIGMKVQPFLPSENGGLIGVDSKIEEVYSLLRVNEKNDIHFIGIWGMGGVGKTTIAREVFERVQNQFEASCFLENVREISERSEGLLELQRKLLVNLGVDGVKVKDSYDGKKNIKNLLCNKRILLILDDVNASVQLKNLAENEKWFGKGSRVIITARDKHLMEAHGKKFEIYKVELLNPNESYQLFFQNAFKGDHSNEGYFELSKSMVKYAGGLPLALIVLGSFLCEKSIPEWESALNMLRRPDPDPEITKILRLSYDGLKETLQQIFLDIACFFKGWNKDHVIQILENCDRDPVIGIKVLIDKSLLTCDGPNLGMHDLLQDMGKSIVINNADGLSRLWSKDHMDYVLTNNKENKAIQGIVFESFEPYERHWNLEAFSKLCNLKLLILRMGLHLCNGLNCLSEALRVLQWERYPLESLPSNIQLNNLVDLKLHHSKVKQLWNGSKVFPKLKFIDLSHSKYLTQTPNVSGVPCLQTMVLKDCINLREVHQSTAQHKKLEVLSLEGCLSLEILPKKLEMNSLKNFILSDCSKVKVLPEFGDEMKSLSMLDLRDCKNLLCLPNGIDNLKSLEILNTSNCSKIFTMTNNLNENEDLEELDISGTAIRDMSLALHSISRLPMLTELDLSYCNLDNGSVFDDLRNLSSLKILDLRGNNFVNLPTHCIASLSKLFSFRVDDCARLQSLPIFPSNVRETGVTGCTSMDFMSYSQRMCDKFALHDPDVNKDSHGLSIPGSDIPTWFDNQNYRSKEILISVFPENECFDNQNYRPDSTMSLRVDIPHHCRSSKNWGIAVCLALEYILTSPCLGYENQNYIDIMWTAPPADYSNVRYADFCLVGEFNYPFLHIGCWSNRFLRDWACDRDSFELIFCSRIKHWCYSSQCEVKEKSKLKIRKCGYRLLWSDNAEIPSNALIETKGCQQDEVEEDDATLSISNPRPSKRAKLL